MLAASSPSVAKAEITVDNEVEKKIVVDGVPPGSSKPSPPSSKAPSKEEQKRRAKEAEAVRKKAEADYRACQQAALAKSDFQALTACGLALENAGVNNGIPGRPDPGTVAREVIARLTLPAATPTFGPDPKLSKIKPNTLLIGFPYWLTVPGDDTLTTTATAQGLTLTMTAHRVRAVFETGDGTTLSCTSVQPWPGPARAYDAKNNPLESPVCGHRYQSLGSVTIRATTYWEVDWSGEGQTGMIPVMFTDAITLPVIEAHAVQR